MHKKTEDAMDRLIADNISLLAFEYNDIIDHEYSKNNISAILNMNFISSKDNSKQIKPDLHCDSNVRRTVPILTTLSQTILRFLRLALPFREFK